MLKTPTDLRRYSYYAYGAANFKLFFLTHRILLYRHSAVGNYLCIWHTLKINIESHCTEDKYELELEKTQCIALSQKERKPKKATTQTNAYVNDNETSLCASSVKL